MGSDVTRQTATERRQSLRRHRKLAKWGMVASMGALVLTGMVRRSPKLRLAHALSGVALLGLSYWHHTLYTNDPVRD
jgi:hypothetical protein